MSASGSAATQCQEAQVLLEKTPIVLFMENRIYNDVNSKDKIKYKKVNERFQS